MIEGVIVYTSLISLIFDPPFPIMEPHWLAGTIKRNVIGGIEFALHVCFKSLSFRERERE